MKNFIGKLFRSEVFGKRKKNEKLGESGSDSDDDLPDFSGIFEKKKKKNKEKKTQEKTKVIEKKGKYPIPEVPKGKQPIKTGKKTVLNNQMKGTHSLPTELLYEISEYYVACFFDVQTLSLVSSRFHEVVNSNIKNLGKRIIKSYFPGFQFDGKKKLGKKKLKSVFCSLYHIRFGGFTKMKKWVDAKKSLSKEVLLQFTHNEGFTESFCGSTQISNEKCIDEMKVFEIDSAFFNLFKIFVPCVLTDEHPSYTLTPVNLFDVSTSDVLFPSFDQLNNDTGIGKEVCITHFKFEFGRKAVSRKGDTKRVDDFVDLTKLFVSTFKLYAKDGLLDTILGFSHLVRLILTLGGCQVEHLKVMNHDDIPYEDQKNSSWSEEVVHPEFDDIKGKFLKFVIHNEGEFYWEKKFSLYLGFTMDETSSGSVNDNYYDCLISFNENEMMLHCIRTVSFVDYGIPYS